MRVALVTCVELPEPDPDEALALDALHAAGLDAALLAWDDPGADLGAFDLCVLRSTWNYYRKIDAFLLWLEAAERVTRILNPPGIVRWNHHKRYLRELSDAGVPIVPTRWLEKGATLPIAETGWRDVVVKPAVSAGSFRTARFQNPADAQPYLDALAAERDAMVQPHVAGVERNLVWIDGSWTHAIEKTPRFADDDEKVSGALALTDEERAFGERVLARVKGDLLYARVDAVRDAAGRLLLSELEVIEPSLFLLQCPRALERFVAAIRARAQAS